MPVLNVENLNKSFGGLKAVSDVNIYVKRGELLGLIGPNGAGKTTIFNLLTGVYVPTTGAIELTGADGRKVKIGGMKPYMTARHGLSRTFQNIRLFKSMTVLENLLVAMHKNVRYTMLEGILRLPRYYKQEARFQEQAMHILSVVGLDSKAQELAENLPYGEQRKLEIARAIATGAFVIFLDEPAAGMNPSETDELARLIVDLKDEYDLTIILIEHDMKFVMGLCERIYVLDFGTIIAEGSPDEIKHNQRVIQAYLGEEA